MTDRQHFSHCAFCGEPLGSSTVQAHVIPKGRGGCNCLENRVDSCWECNNAMQALTPIEWWAKHQWDTDDESMVTQFDSGGWTLAQRQEFLLQAAYWEARARWHLFKSKEHKSALPRFDL